jgi:tetratricopeptide (TPR) repeat protein
MTDLKPSAQVIALLAVLSILPYLNALRAGFTLDDVPNIREYAAVTKGIDLTEIVATPMPLLAYVYRPFTVLTFAVNEALAPGNAAVFHAVNLLLHAGVTILVFWLAIRLFDAGVAVIAAVLFAVHPLHTEAVTSLVGRAELLGALFGLLAVLAAGAIDTAANRTARRAWHAFSVVCFVGAVFSKESAVTILPLVLLYRVTRRGEPLFGGMWKEVRSLDWVPYALCFCTFLFFRFLVVGTLAGIPGQRVTPLDNVLAFVPLEVRIRSALGVLWDYFALLNVPLVLSADYSFNQVPISESWGDARCLAGLLLLGAAAVVVVCARRPAVRFCVAFPFVALLLTANLLFPIGTVKAERLLYLPSVGWTLLVAVGIDGLLRTPRYRAAGTALALLIVFAFAARTWARNEDWKDDPALFASMARSAPNSAKAQYNLGIALRERGAQAAAVARFEQALAIAPWTEAAALDMGVAYEQTGHPDAAAEWYRRALQIAPDLHGAHTNLCHVLFDNERFAAAKAACRNGLRYDPADANLLKGLGASLVALGETDKGLEVLRRSLALNASDHELAIYVARLERKPAGTSAAAVRVE